MNQLNIAETKNRRPMDGKIVYTNGKEKVLKHGITEIAKSEYESDENIESIVLPNSVTSVGERAFASCRGLKSVTLMGGITSIGKEAFMGCWALERIDMPSSITSIGPCAFMNCERLASVHIPRVTDIKWGTFSGCKELKKMTMENSVVSIEANAFVYCESLEKIVIPAGVSKIEGNPFCGFTGTLEVSPENECFKVIDNNLYSIDGKEMVSFIDDGSRTEFTVPEGVTSVGTALGVHFGVRSNIESITLPHGVTEIEDGAFRYCKKLKRITLPDSITSMGSSAFSYCESLESIKIPASIEAIERYAFDHCESLKHVYYEGTKRDWQKIVITPNGNEKLCGKRAELAKIHYKCK